MRRQAARVSKVGVLEGDPEILRGREPRHGWLLPVSFLVAAALGLAAWRVVADRGREAQPRVFESENLGCRFEYPASLTAGPNFVRTRGGAFFTVERHSLREAKKEFVAGLPEVLLPQVLIQLDQGYRDLEEVSRRKVRIAGADALEVVFEGFAGASRRRAIVTVDILASPDWVYVLRAYSPKADHERNRDLFDRVRSSFSLLAGAAGPP